MCHLTPPFYLFISDYEMDFRPVIHLSPSFVSSSFTSSWDGFFYNSSSRVCHQTKTHMTSSKSTNFLSSWPQSYQNSTRSTKTKRSTFSSSIPQIVSKLESQQYPSHPIDSQNKNKVVDIQWYPWAPETFKKAQDEQKMIFLFITYPTCSWCTKMEQGTLLSEKFPDIALMLQTDYIPVKVDRNIRPDLDSVYAAFLRATIQVASWPMCIFLIPQSKESIARDYKDDAVLSMDGDDIDDIDKNDLISEIGYPFVGASYIPPDKFEGALKNIKNKWKKDPHGVRQEGLRAIEVLSSFATATRYSKQINQIVDEVGDTSDFEWHRLKNSEEFISWKQSALIDALQTATSIYDVEHGRFRPKNSAGTEDVTDGVTSDASYASFPRAPSFLFLLDVYQVLGDSSTTISNQQLNNTAFDENSTDLEILRTQAFRMALTSLDQMGVGGIYDHIGGGFFRSTRDPSWALPCFEKSLADQAQLVGLYLKAYQITGKPFYQDIVEGILEYVTSELSAHSKLYCDNPETNSYLKNCRGAFCHGQDSESQDPLLSNRIQQKKKDTKLDGAFYLWTDFEIQLILQNSKLSNAFKEYYGVTLEGNCKDPSMLGIPLQTSSLSKLPMSLVPQAVIDGGANVLRISKPIAKIAENYGVNSTEMGRLLKEACIRLNKQRQTRPLPLRDETILTFDNAMITTAFCHAFQVFKIEKYKFKALEAANFLKTQMLNESKKIIYRNFAVSQIDRTPGVAEDYGHVVEAFLNVYQMTNEGEWLELAEVLQRSMFEQFWDRKSGGFVETSEAMMSDIPFRPKIDYDGSEPCSGSLAARNCFKLMEITSKKEWQKSYVDVILSYSLILQKSGFSLPAMITTLLKEL